MMPDGLPAARIDILRYLHNQVTMKHGCRLTRLVIDDETPEGVIRLEFVTRDLIVPFDIDDPDWQDVEALVDFVLTNVDKSIEASGD